MDALGNGWFSELGTLWPGQCFSLQVKDVIHREKSKFQDIVIFQSENYGRVLVLDNVIQCTERDEFAYQEMISFLPLNSHPNPEKVLVIGGGDGGVVREVIKHKAVKSVTLCEIDEAVIRLSKKYLPTLAEGFESPKLDIFIGDGLEFIQGKNGEFDVIITDSSDPIGPGENLFVEEYYKKLKSALRPNGIICCQGECQWLSPDLIKNILGHCKNCFSVVSYAYTTIPSYPCGQIGFILASLNPETNFQKPIWRFNEEDLDDMKLKYYDTNVHSASFVLPRFARIAFGGVLCNSGT